jgi:hypothetical protein
MLHENLSTVMCFAYSRKSLNEMVERVFMGEWKYLRKALFEISAQRAEKACLELALFLRILDDEWSVSEYEAQTGHSHDCGKLIMKDGTQNALPFREVANKVIHASGLTWDFEKAPDPLLICHSRDKEKWLRAEVNIGSLAGVCGMFMSRSMTEESCSLGQAGPPFSLSGNHN